MSIQAEVSYVPGVDGARRRIAVRFPAAPGATVVTVTDLATNLNVGVTAGATVADANDANTIHYDTADIVGLNLETVGQKQLAIHFTPAVGTPEQALLTVLPADAILALYDGAINVAKFGVAGAVRGVNGTRGNPVDNIANARTLANLLGFRRLRFLGDDGSGFALTAADWGNFNFSAEGFQTGKINVSAGTGFNGANFSELTVAGAFPAGVNFVQFLDCGFDETVPITLPLIAIVRRTTLSGVITWTAGVGIFLDCWDQSTVLPPRIDMNGLGTPSGPISFRNYAGDIRFDNMTVAATLDLHLNGGTVILDASCTAGTVKVAGVGRVINNGSGITLDTSELVDPESIAILRAHKDAFVLDGGVGQANVTIDAQGFMTAGRVRVFRTPAEATAATKGAADGADGEIFASDVTGVNTGTPGDLATMDIVGQ